MADRLFTERYSSSILSQTVKSPGIGKAYASLFEVGQGSQFLETPFSEEFVGADPL